MISSASSTPPTGSTNLPFLPTKSGPRPETLGTDNLTLGKTSEMRSSIAQEPEIRADVVARAEALARDPDYPSPQILRDIASRLINSPDLSEQAD